VYHRTRSKGESPAIGALRLRDLFSEMALQSFVERGAEHPELSEAGTLPRAVLFDMDGTLTEPLLDFARIRREMGIGDRPILETLARLDPEQRCIAEAVLLRHEDHAADTSTLNPGCRQVLRWLDEQEVKIALVTRNSRRSLDRVMKRHILPFDVMVTRDDCAYKPNPEPLLLACRRLEVSPADAWMVGDGSHDVQAGIAAKIRTVWISHGRARDFPEVSWRVARDLIELNEMLRACVRM
jgi:HAD superfamily hydrolase (TIGR01549 family)